jgi:glycine dehydrogenase
MYAVYHGPEGLTRIARRTHRLASILAAALRNAGVQVGGDFFDTLHVTGVHADEIHAKAAPPVQPARDRQRLGRHQLDETTTRADIVAVAAVFGARWTSTRWMPAPPTRCRPACCASPRS